MFESNYILKSEGGILTSSYCTTYSKISMIRFSLLCFCDDTISVVVCYVCLYSNNMIVSFSEVRHTVHFKERKYGHYNVTLAMLAATFVFFNFISLSAMLRRNLKALRQAEHGRHEGHTWECMRWCHL